MLHGIKNKLAVLLFIASVCFSITSQAGFNPFNKDKEFKFGAEVPWRTYENGAIKSGLNRRKGDNYYYHLSVNEQHLLLRLSKNDEDGARKVAWPLETLDILDVSVDGSTLPQFQWCLDNRVNPASFPILSVGVAVKDNVCIVSASSSGGFIIKLNSDLLQSLKHAIKLQVVIKMGKKVTKLNYSMEGFEVAFNKFRSLHKTPVKKITKNKPQSRVQSKPKLCLVKPPVKFASKIKPVSYPCNDKTLQAKAKQNINSKIAIQKRKQKEEAIALQKRKQESEKQRLRKLEEQRLAEIERKRLLEKEKKALLEQQKREKKLEEIESSSWLNRCKRKWTEGVSPCYCQSYVKEYSPKGIVNTCHD